MANKNEIAQALTSLQNLPGSPITPANVGEIVNQYNEDLGDIPADILIASVLMYRAGANPFFPTSGQLREKATELMLISMGVPTAAEAWAQVKRASITVTSHWCDEGARLRDEVVGKAGNNYWTAIHKYGTHMDNCDQCREIYTREVYDHPAVKNAVDRIGGRAVILTGNDTADKAHFMRAYTEIIQTQTRVATLPQPIRDRLAISEPIMLLAESKKV